jgi:hypothetical protein
MVKDLERRRLSWVTQVILHAITGVLMCKREAKRDLKMLILNEKWGDSAINIHQKVASTRRKKRQKIDSS